MTVKRFFGESARDALRKVKAALGPEAIVISNKPVQGGVEIMAMSADSLEALQGADPAAAKPVAARQATGKPTAVPPAPTMTDDESDYAVSLSAKARAPTPFQSWQPWQPPQAGSAAKPVAATERTERPRPRPLPPKQQSAAPAVSANPARREPQGFGTSFDPSAFMEPGMLATPDSNPQVQQLMSEMQSIKSMLERQLAGFAWNDMTRHAPTKAQLLGEMLESGFSGVLTRRLVEDMPEDLDLQAGRKWLASAVNRRLRTLTRENDLIERGGVFALVGPTGVGKTTTTAKLAARCVVRYGAEKLALLTTDGYRIGAHEQLRIYGRILGVPVHVVRDSEDLRRTLADLRGKHMVLIDTVGMSQRDRMVAEQAAMLMRAGDVRRLLLLNATSRGDTLDDVIRSYAGEDIAGCILTKVDETASLAPAVDAVVRHGLLMAYVANGQRVPEDLHLPNRNYLLHRAFKQPSANSAHHLKQDEVGLVMPSSQAASQLSPQGVALA
ncbi:MAG: flagellar biosynthesis protein FlhF [Rhodocyclaceae bacterium]|nr:flagellar biosynthesis protein FlhF [Rhodocyclaceae bacterium]MDZ4215224.1 flagellar biosynthesis protein FlhF [Rhodocyclaceae bacterium]